LRISVAVLLRNSMAVLLRISVAVLLRNSMAVLLRISVAVPLRISVAVLLRISVAVLRGCAARCAEAAMLHAKVALLRRGATV